MSNKKCEWEWKKLGEVCEFNSGYTPKSEELSSNGIIPYFKVSDMNRDSNTLFMMESDLYVKHPKKIFKKDSVVFPKNGGAVFTNKKRILGRDSVIDLNSQAVISKDCKVVETVYLYNFFLTIDLKDFSKGAALPTLEMSLIKNIDFPVPPLAEQERIVKVLDDAFAKIDKIKTDAETNLQNAKDLFQTTLANELSITDEKIKEGWAEKCVKEIGTTQTGNTPPTSDKSNYGDYIPFIKPGDVNTCGNGELNYQNEMLSKSGLAKAKLIKKGSTLMVCIGATIGKVGFAENDVTCNQQINAVTPSNDFEPKFIYYAMICSYFQNEVLENGKAAQATLPIINKTKWENLIISYPLEIDIQKQIVAKLDSLSEKVKQLESNYKHVIADCDELKKSILKKAFEGQL